MYRRILVAADGSGSSINAFRLACKISRKDKSWIGVVTTIPPYQDLFQIPNVKEKISRKLKAEGERILSKISKTAAEEDIDIKTFLEEGDPLDSIIDISEEGSYGLIVMGRHGKKRIERTFMGNVTARVIGHSRKDVLVVPATASLEFGNVLLCTDGSKYSAAAVERAIEFAVLYGSAMTAISVVDVSEEFYVQAPEAVDKLIDKAKEFLSDVKGKAGEANIDIETVVREGETYEEVVKLAKKKKADVIFMGSHGRTGLKRLLMGSVTEMVIGHASCPVFVVKGK